MCYLAWQNNTFSNSDIHAGRGYHHPCWICRVKTKANQQQRLWACMEIKYRIQEQDEILSSFALFFPRLWPVNLSHLGSWDSGQEVIFNMKRWKHSLCEPSQSNKTQLGSTEVRPLKTFTEGPTSDSLLRNCLFKKVFVSPQCH